ncbi:MAG: polysaccharide deacetylase family protein [Fulvivirga sp.]
MRQSSVLILLLFIALNSCQQSNKADNEEDSKQVGHSSEINDKEIVCFVYHRFGDGRYPSTNISLKDFEAHLQYLKENDYQVLSFSSAIKYLKSESKTQKTAVITIDDGYKSFIQNGLPLLRKYDFPATLFINTETVGGGDYMDWEEIEKAMNNKIEIGNHTHSHDYFLNLPETSRHETFEEEIKLSQQLIEEQTGQVPDIFAYPYGELDPKMKEIVKNSGFIGAAAQNSGVISSGSDLMQCPRFPMSEAYAGIDKFTSKAEMRALKVINITPSSFIIPENKSKPELKLNVNRADLQLDRLQCFIQGVECRINKSISENGEAIITLSPASGIENRRRTLYTVTVPDTVGNWHWFSHLFINPQIR